MTNLLLKPLLRPLPRSPLSPSPSPLPRLRRDPLLLSPPEDKKSMLLASTVLLVRNLLPVVAVVVAVVAEAKEAVAVAKEAHAEAVVARDAPDPRDPRVSKDLELRVAAEEALAPPEETLVRLLKVTRVSLLPTERRRSTMKVRSTTSLESKEKSTPSTERTALAEAEASPRVVLARATGELFRMKLSRLPPLKVRPPPLKRLRLRMPQSKRQRLRLPSPLPLLMRRTNRTRASLPLLSTSQTRRSPSLRRKAEAMRRSRESSSRLLKPRLRRLSPS